MKTRQTTLIVLCVFAGLALVGCAQVSPGVVRETVIVVQTQAPLPTYTAYPTYTPQPPLPTYTFYPTYTPGPPTATYTPQPTPTTRPRPTQTPTTAASYEGNKQQPIPFGRALELTMGEDQEFSLALTDAVRGPEAWNRILQENQFNDKPLAGMEYLLVFVKLTYARGPSDKQLQFDKYIFHAVSKQEVIDVPSLVLPEPEFDVSFFPGASGGGWVALMVYEDDPDPLLVAWAERSAGGFFFATHE